VTRAKALALRSIRALKILARDERIPKPLRWIAGLALLPIPGPFDEAVLILISPLFLVYREPLSEAWSVAGASRVQRTDRVLR
jgi:hypothetical protein